MSGTAGGLALVLSSLLLVGSIVGFSVLSARLPAATSFLQKGNFTWEFFTGSSIDPLVANYRFYQTATGYLLELDPPSRPIAIADGVATSQSYIQIRMHNFHPPIIPFNTLGWWEFLLPLSTSNAAALQPDGPCYQTLPDPLCNMVGWTGGGLLGENAISFNTEDNFPNYRGFAFFNMQQIQGNNQDWANYTFTTTRTLSLNLPSV